MRRRVWAIIVACVPLPVRRAVGPTVAAVARIRSRDDAIRVSAEIGWRVPRRRADARLLLDSGVFDASFYARQVGIDPCDEMAAARHFVVRRAAGRVSSHPLFSVELMPRRAKTIARALGVPGLLRYLRSAEGVKRPWGPFFEITDVIDVAPGAAIEAPHLRASLGAVRGDTELRPSAILAHGATRAALPAAHWREFRASMLKAADRLHAQKVLATPIHPTRSWDSLAEERWLATLPPLEHEPLVSIVMPAWNRASIIGEAIASVRAQRYRRWELLVVDDGSVDDTPDVVRRFATEDPRIRLFEPGRGGAAAARNVGLREAQGELVAFLDTDNTWLPGFLDAMVRGMQTTGSRVAYSAIRLWEGEKTPRYRAVEVSLDLLLVRNQIDMNVLVADLALVREVGGFDAALRKLIDYDLVLRLAMQETPLLLPFIGAEYEHSFEDPHRITLSALDTYRWVVHEKSLVNWQEVSSARRVAGRTSFVLLASTTRGSALASIRSLLPFAVEHDIEIVVVDNGQSAQRSLDLAAVAAGLPQVVHHRIPRAFGAGVAFNVGISLTTGEHVVVLDPGTVWRFGSLSDLLAPLSRPEVRAVQGIVVDHLDHITSAGTRLRGSAEPERLLTGRPVRDASVLAGVELTALSGGLFAMRAEELVDLCGFDAVYSAGIEAIDLSLRALDARGGHVAVAPSVVASTPAGRAGSVRAPGDEHATWPLLVERRGSSLPQEADGMSSRPRAEVGQRWGLKNFARAGTPGDAWGDTYFLAHLADSLERLGQHAVEHRRQAHDADITGLDDVSLTLRGIMPARRQDGACNVLWVISHPEDVTPEELKAFDLVYAASPRWAAAMTEAHGVEVRTLLQATDAQRFSPRPDITLPGADAPVVFIGQARPTGPRPIVMDALAAGLDVKVWGPHWKGHIPAASLAGEWMANDQLRATYQSARVVLADHHPDMAREGFIANRLFDAVCAGARVISDAVEGIDEIFGGAVQVYESPEHLAWLTSEDGMREAFPDEATMAQISRHIAAEHSFDARARSLVVDVARVH